MSKLTIAQATADLIAVGITLTRTEDGQFRVNFKGGDEATASYADDLQDAHDTGYAMAEQKAKPAEVAAPSDTFLMQVMNRLRSEGVDAVLSPAEVDLCQMASNRGVGPVDTACQIVANRSDVASISTLSHGQYVRLASWTHSVASVGTLAGMELSPESVAMCLKRGDAECWTVYAGATISDSRAFYERDVARVAGATVIADGETVEIDGKRYRVRVIRGNDGRSPRNSDPIHFDAI